MGKKSKRKKTNNGGPPRKGLAAAVVPTAAAAAPEPTIYDTIRQLFDSHKYDEILKVESKYRHLDTFSNNPVEDAYVLFAFGRANYESSEKDETCLNCAIIYYERAKVRVEDANTGDRREAKKIFKAGIEKYLALLYSNGLDMEKAISSHRWFLTNCNRDEVSGDEVTAKDVITLGHNFNRFNRFEYTIEVLVGSMDIMKTLEEDVQAEYCLIDAYIGCGEFLKAKAANKKRRRSTDINDWLNAAWQSGRIEDGLCNYKAAINRFREVVAELQKEEYDDSLSRSRHACSLDLASTLLRHSTANEAEAFAIFQEELDHCVDPLEREEILFRRGIWYRKLKKWDQSIETLHQLCLSATRLNGIMLPRANVVMAQTYLEQYCTDTTLTINQRTEILCHANTYSIQVDEVSTEMYLTQAQLFYFNGDKHEAYCHLELYLDALLAECKLTCYTCDQRVRHGSVPFSCASCKVASYCGRKHQKLTWKNERICHKVLCPLLGYWRKAKKRKRRRERNGRGNEDQSESVRVFEAFFESICSRGLNIADGNLSKADSIESTSRQEAAQIAKEAKEAKEKEFVLLGENPLLK